MRYVLHMCNLQPDKSGNVLTSFTTMNVNFFAYLVCRQTIDEIEY